MSPVGACSCVIAEVLIVVSGRLTPFLFETRPATSTSVAAPTAALDPNGTRSLLGNSSAIVEAQVEKVQYTYDAHTGPRTVADVTVTNVVAGELSARHLTIPMFGYRNR